MACQQLWGAQYRPSVWEPTLRFFGEDRVEAGRTESRSGVFPTAVSLRALFRLPDDGAMPWWVSLLSGSAGLTHPWPRSPQVVRGDRTRRPKGSAAWLQNADLPTDKGTTDHRPEGLSIDVGATYCTVPVVKVSAYRSDSLWTDAASLDEFDGSDLDSAVHGPRSR